MTGGISLSASDVLVVADDLAGAAEAAAAMMATSRASFELRLGTGTAPASGDAALVIDTDSRYCGADEARRRIRAALAARSSAALVLKKADSLLRGRIEDEIVELRSGGRRVIACFALPSLDRTVVGGVLRIGGVALHETSAWEAEADPPPTTVSAVFGGMPTRVIPLAVVRSGRLGQALADALDAGVTPLCDAEEQSDLERVADAALRLPSRYRIVLVGTGGLARALGRLLNGPESDGRARRPDREAPVLIVAGTLAENVVEQAARVEAAGFPSLVVTNADLADDAARAALGHRVLLALGSGAAAVSLDRSERWSRDAADGLARVVAGVLLGIGGPVDLVLTGGETARRVLDAVGETALFPLEEIQHGTVLSRSASGSLVVTRPGSFGSPDSFVEIVAALRSPSNPMPGKAAQ